MAKLNQREKNQQALLKQAVNGDFQKIAADVWEASLVARANLSPVAEKAVRKDGTLSFTKMNYKDQLRVTANVLVNLMAQPTYLEALAEWAHREPGQLAKMVVGMMPKEVEIDINQNIGIVVLPAKAGSVSDWMDMVNGTKVIDAEAIGTEGVSAAEIWKKTLENKTA